MLSVECRLREWDRRELSQVTLTAADRAFIKRISNQHLEVVETRDGLVVETRGHVGILQLESVRICVEPKLIGGARNLVRLIDYTRRLDLMTKVGGFAGIETGSEDLFELLVRLFAGECEDVLNAGVVADYLARRDELRVLRGRLDVKAQVLRRWGQVDRLICDYEERLTDTPENQWLLRALRVAARGVTQQGLSALVRRLLATWEEFCEDDPTVVLERPTLNRANHHYSRALEIAYLLIEGVGVQDILQFGSRQSFAFLLNMSRLFEEFVASALEQQLAGTGATVRRQVALGSVLWDPDSSAPLGNVRPDVMVTSHRGKFRLPVDAKYKDYGERKLAPSDIYQAAVYATSLATEGAEGIRTCLLVYPSTGPTAAPQRVQVRDPRGPVAEVTAIGIPVERVLAEQGNREVPPFTLVRRLIESHGLFAVGA
jgi:5-methylcytosine-specific restriction enzyme subunit McrC